MFLLQGLISAMLVGVIAIVGGIFTFQYWISLPQNTSKLTLYGISLGSIVVSLVNAVIIAVMKNQLFFKLHSYFIVVCIVFKQDLHWNSNISQ